MTEGINNFFELARVNHDWRFTLTMELELWHRPYNAVRTQLAARPLVGGSGLSMGFVVDESVQMPGTVHDVEMKHCTEVFRSAIGRLRKEAL